MPKRAPPEADAYMLVRALGEARPPKHGRLKEREAGIVWWQDFVARFRALPPEEAMMWDAAAKGRGLQRAPSPALTPPSSAASYLKG
ncbi:MAG: hypothetical protein WBE50_16905 [Methyloceanibacter sp.]